VPGRGRGARDVIALAGELFPTPAVCGAPRAAARAIIESEEPERGWYTGAVGWMDDRGDGELAVALRSARVAGRELTIWGGAGIVEGSDADAELAETEAKMAALVAPFVVRSAEAAGAPRVPAEERP
jgi:isochorismate synthase